MTSKTNSKIGVSSRYYEPFRILKAKVASQNVFKLVHNEDKGTYSLPYLYGNYKNDLEPVSISNKIIKSIKQYLDDNLFSLDEKKLLLSELMPYVSTFGDDTINSLTNRIGLTDEKDKYSQIISEYEKTIKSLKQINEIINNEFVAYFTSMTSENYLQTNNQSAYTIMKSKEDIEELILDQFRKTNSRANHIVMIRVFRFSIIPKLNPK